MTARPLAAVILAAGKGTRMKSDMHKVLHPIAGRPMLGHLLASVDALAPAHKVVVVGSGREQVEPFVQGEGGVVAVQYPQHGTAHAVQQAESALAGFDGDVLILYGDVPFVSADTMRRMIERLAAPDTPAAVVVGFRPDDPKHYGRILAGPDGAIEKMVEYKDASEAERAIDLCNSGLMAARSADLWPLLARVGNDNAAGEYYLPDIVMLAAAEGRVSAVIEVAPGQVEGVNSRGELADAELAWQRGRRRAMMDAGVTLTAPGTVWFAYDTQVGRDVTIEPNVFIEPGVRIGDRSRIEPHLIIPENSEIPADTLVKRSNLYTFANTSTCRSSAWTGRFSLSERARVIVDFGPAVICSLSETILTIEARAHNNPPNLVEQDEFERILGDLRALRQSISELIDSIEQGRGDERFEAVHDFYAGRVAPWFRDRLGDAGQGLNNLLSATPALFVAYVALSRMFDEPELAQLMSGALGAVLGAQLVKSSSGDQRTGA